VGGHFPYGSLSLGMACPRVVDGGDDPQLWREAAKILNKQSQTADKGDPAWSWARG
jgi:hypothetical protein